ncbi:hypothetical protein [Bacillus atrophaeus]|uniref:hypothetical protein n=1 Tax=Bacillus atrophaeus TaxID=1452 RepID=UPI0022816B97|nr:hypothetical protein [Bacillus atrophaeus]MCY8922477.1 hypothetical protein [Bacillus atrophaeus]
MYNVEYLFIVNGDWETVKHDVLDYKPEEGEVIYYEGERYNVVDASGDDDDLHLFLD